MSEKPSVAPTSSVPDQLVMEYIKGQHFRVVHVDGAIGGPTPSGHIHLAVFSERPAIPRRVVARLHDGVIGEAIEGETVVRDGVVREMDVDLMMSLSAAEEISKLLGKMVADTRSAIEKNRSKVTNT